MYSMYVTYLVLLSRSYPARLSTWSSEAAVQVLLPSSQGRGDRHILDGRPVHRPRSAQRRQPDFHSTESH